MIYKTFAKKFEKDNDHLFILYDTGTFWDFFKELRKAHYGPEQALQFILANCVLSALVFQECIFNDMYKKA